jgi:predicted esterase
MIVGFHGYAEDAEAELERLRAIVRPAVGRPSPSFPDDWLIVSVQAVNRFYRGRSQDVVAGWMTRQDRELAIADNCAYVHAVVDEAFREWLPTSTLVFSGFSQGVAMAFRAAVTSPRPVRAVVVGGGDVPPELSREQLRRVPAALVGRGVRDGWYTTAKLDADLVRLRDARVDVTVVEFDGGHEWGAPLVDAARVFLEPLP